jgi:mRNA interferase YafQ
MSQFLLSPNSYFKKKYLKLIQKNPKIKPKLITVFNSLMQNPFHTSLKTHKVDAKIANQVFSSRVTGDLRIIWQFDNYKINVIDLLDLGGHSGSTGVYK